MRRRTAPSREESIALTPFLVLSDVLLTLLLVVLFYFTAMLCILSVRAYKERAFVSRLLQENKEGQAAKDLVSRLLRENDEKDKSGRLVLEHQKAVASDLNINAYVETVGKKSPPVCYNINGATQRFIFNEEVLFAKGKPELLHEGRLFLRDFCPKLEKALLKERRPWRPDPEIQIEGHTDTTGSATLNWTISGQRALNVIVYITQEGLIHDSNLREHLSLAGYAYNKPLEKRIWNKDQPRNRRFEMQLIYHSIPEKYPADMGGNR